MSNGGRIRLKKEAIKLFWVFMLFILVWVIANMFNMNILWFVIVSVIAIRYIVKEKNIDRKDIIIACAFGIVSIPSAFGAGFILSELIMGIVTIPAYLGAMSILKSSNNEIFLIKYGKKEIAISFSIAIGIGSILGVINLLLANYPINLSVKLKWFLDAINAGVTEEIIFRLFFFAICVAVVKDKKMSKSENVMSYLIMTIPHVLIHFNFQTVDLGSIIVLFVLFGMPFAILQRKRDLTSAIVAHAVVDLIRFVLVGM